MQRCIVIYLAAQSFDDAFRLFTVVNDRGKQLRRIDILKAENLAPTIITSDTTRMRYASEWEGLEEALGEDNFEELFHSLRLIFVQEKPQGDLHKEFTNRVFGKPGRPAPGVDFIDVLATYVDLYSALFDSRDYLQGTPDHAKFKTLMGAMLLEFKASEWKACVLFFAKKFGVGSTYQFLLLIEKVFLEQWVAGVRKDERYSRYTDILKKIESSSSADSVLQSISFDASSISDACRAINFYGVGYAKYLLLRAEVLASELNDPRDFTVRSVEHILPQNPASGSDWLTAFDQSARDELTHTAGNLVLLSKGKNSSAQNHEFAVKKSTYLAPRVSDFPRSMEILGVESWTPDLIRARTDAFADSILGDP